jgi:AraC family transcriptional regulator
MASLPPTRATVEWKTLPRMRILDMGVTIDPPGATYGPRVQNHYEFIWVMEGEAKATFDRRMMELEEGCILLRRPGVKDYYEWSPRRRTVHAYVHFDLDPQRRSRVSKPFVPAFRKMPPNDILRPLFGFLLQVEGLREPQRSELALPALDLMLRAYGSGEVTIKPSPHPRLPEAVVRVVEVIRLNTAQSPPAPLKLKELSQAAHTTPENLCRLFKKSLQVGPLEYVKLSRLDRAANQLRRTPSSLKEIALSTGFYDAFHLSRSFKKVYGISPKEFRETVDNEWVAQKNPIIRMLDFENQPTLSPKNAPV